MMAMIGAKNKRDRKQTEDCNWSGMVSKDYKRGNTMETGREKKTKERKRTGDPKENRNEKCRKRRKRQQQIQAR